MVALVGQRHEHQCKDQALQKQQQEKPQIDQVGEKDHHRIIHLPHEIDDGAAEHMEHQRQQ